MESSALSAILPPEMGDLRARPLFAFSLDVGKPQVVGRTPGVDRRIGEVLGGRFEGERLKGKILGGGSDWQAVRAWLNGVVAVGVGHRLPTGPVYQVFEVL